MAHPFCAPYFITHARQTFPTPVPTLQSTGGLAAPAAAMSPSRLPRAAATQTQHRFRRHPHRTGADRHVALPASAAAGARQPHQPGGR